MPLKKGKSNKTRAENIRKLIVEGYADHHGQAAAIAYRTQRQARSKSRKRK